MRETAADPLSAFRTVNLEGTLTLARQAAAARVRRFVFISSIGVNGAQTHGQPFTVADPPAPHSPYALSKLEAEIALQELARETGLEVVIIRPPLVFGPGAPGNFERLMRALHRGIPLPFGAIDNRRSLVALCNLTDLIATVIDHPGAANQLFLVSDGEDLSTTTLLRKTAAALHRPARLIAVPAWLMERTLTLTGRKQLAQSLLGSLQIDISYTCERLAWKPPVRIDEALFDTAQAFLTAETQR
jgi:nucleoside-diphosphate-sugar epimerase